jgi:NitT/TauT family transport system ATP-binding protein
MSDVMPVTVHLQGIRKRFAGGPWLFEGLDFHANSGEVVALVGPSGSGKTTLLNIVSLLEPIEGGTVHLLGEPCGPRQLGKIPLSYLFQDSALLPWATIWQNVLLGVECHNAVNGTTREHARMWMERLGLTGCENAYPSMLSGGQRQRVAIAQSLLLDPRIFLLDEPASSLDFQNKLILEEELLRVVRTPTESGQPRTALLVTHDIEQALVLADRIMVIGRRRGEPAHVALELPVPVPAAERDPVRTRQSPELREAFGIIWNALKPFVRVEGV